MLTKHDHIYITRSSIKNYTEFGYLRAVHPETKDERCLMIGKDEEGNIRALCNWDKEGALVEVGIEEARKIVKALYAPVTKHTGGNYIRLGVL